MLPFFSGVQFSPQACLTFSFWAGGERADDRQGPEDDPHNRGRNAVVGEDGEEREDERVRNNVDNVNVPNNKLPENDLASSDKMAAGSWNMDGAASASPSSSSADRAWLPPPNQILKQIFLFSTIMVLNIF